MGPSVFSEAGKSCSFDTLSAAKEGGETAFVCSSGNNSDLGCSELHLYEVFFEEKGRLLFWGD